MQNDCLQNCKDKVSSALKTTAFSGIFPSAKTPEGISIAIYEHELG